MKNKFLNLLFLFCGLVLIIGTVNAEEFGEAGRYDFSIFDMNEEGEEGEEGQKSSSYTSACSKFTDITERINCCNQDETVYGRNECKKSLFNVCMTGKSPSARTACCEEKFTGDEMVSCKEVALTYCDVTDKVRLSKAASAVKIEYEPVEIKADGYDNPDSPNYSVLIYALDIKVYNVTDEIVVVVEPEGGTGYTITEENSGPEGYITLRDDNLDSIKNYKFVVYSNSGVCESQPLRTIKLSTPKYNHLSNRDACREAPHYYKCQELISYDFEEGNYVKDIEEYKEKLAKQGIKESETKNVANKGVVSKCLITNG